jgi:multiple sugar transport system substrate-binding protein
MSKKISRRDFLRISATAGMGLAFTGLVGCAPAAAPTTAAGSPTQAPAADNQSMILNYWTGWSGIEFNALQKSVDKYNTENPTKFFTMTTVYGQYDKVLTAIAGGNPPDVVSAVWLNQLVSMAGRNGLTSLTPFAEKDGIDGKAYWPNVWESWHWNNQLWGMAITVDAATFVYRRDIFKEVSLDADNPPKTVADLDAANAKLEKIDSSGAIQRVGMLPGSIYNWGRVYGGDWFDEASKKFTIDSPQNVAALDWIAGYSKRLGADKVAAFHSGEGDFLSANNPFFVGLETIYGAGEWMIHIVRDYAPDTQYDYLTYPYPEGGREKYTSFDGSVFTIPAGVKHSDAAWGFIKWLSADANMADIDFAFQNIPPKTAVATSDRFISDPRFKFNVDVYNGKNTFGPPKTPVTDTLFSSLSNAEGFASRGEKTAAQAMKDAQAEVQAALDKFNNKG